MNYSFVRYKWKEYVNSPSRIKSFICWHVPAIPLEQLYRAFHKGNIFTINNIKMYLPFKHDPLQAEIIIHKRFFEYIELAKIHDVIKPGMNIIDVGANIGNHTVYFASILGAKNVYSFEPLSITASILKKNIQLNDLENIVTLFECGLGSLNTKAKVLVDGAACNNLGSTELSECADGEIEIKRLDDLHIPEKIDFIKIDVEGMESRVLEGAKETIRRDKPLIWVEIFNKNCDKVNSILSSLGYVKLLTLSQDNYLFEYGGLA